jgi:DnaK suppressor protein
MMRRAKIVALNQRADAEGSVSAMAATNKKITTMNTQRYSDLKLMLEERKKEILAQLKDKIRDVRAENVSGKVNTVLDPGESSEVGIQEDIEFALIQMKAETLNKINEALNRLEEGAYGNCFECGDEISHPRLRALPFAVRCRDCEAARENAQKRERMASQRSSSSALYFDLSS